MGKSTISMAIFHSKLLVYQAGYFSMINFWEHQGTSSESHGSHDMFFTHKMVI